MESAPTPHPIQIVVRDRALERRRLTVVLRLILAIPHIIWWWLWGIAIVVVAPVLWAWALVTGGPTGLHGFYGAYVRYSVHLHAYVSLAADPYPGFLGEPGYPVDLELPAPARQNRWTIAFRIVLWLPAGVLASALVGGGSWSGGTGTSTSDGDWSWTYGASFAGVLALVAIGAWFVILARGRTNPGLRDLAVYCLGYAAQAYGYLALLTDRYPDSAPALSRPWPQAAHPVRLTVDDDRRRSRLTVLFRLLLALPHLVWLTLWGVVALLAAIANWVATLVAGRSPDPLHRFLGAYVRYRVHVGAFLSLAANPFPGFVGRPGTYPVDLEIDPSARQSRWITGFRIVLAIPAAFLSSALGSAAFVAAVLGWFAALVTGRMPRGLRDLLAFCLRYDGQLSAYANLLTDRYPYSGPTLETGPVPAGLDPLPAGTAPAGPPSPGAAPGPPPPDAAPGGPPPGWAPPAPPRDLGDRPEAPDR